MYHKKIQNYLDRFPQRCEEEIPERLPLLDDFRKNNKKIIPSLADVNLLLIQHNLAPYIRRLETHFNDGFAHDKTWMVDIPYSTNEGVRKKIRQLFPIPDFHIAPPFRDPLAPYSSSQLRRVENMIYYIANRLSDNPRERLLVIDDGAYFVRALSNLEIHEPGITGIFRNRTHIVEQTTRGHRYFKKPKYKDLVENSIKAPVVSIAKCKTKVKFESPFIGAAASRALVNRFEHENIDIRKFRRIAIIGFGPVGEAVFRALRPLFNRKMIVVDKDEHTHQKIVDLKGEPHASLPEDGGFDLVVGCTGYRSFKLSDWDRLSRNALLISTSSAAVEFNRKQFIDITELSENNEYKIVNKERVRKAGMHANIKIKDKKRDRSVTFINASFPVNFDGRMECLPADIIQATHTLLYAAGYQALQSHKPGFAKLDDEFDNQIYTGALDQI